MIEIINLYKSYKNGDGEFHALNNISLKINQGEFISIVGPSGSGKSTLMHLIGGLDNPTKGDIIINNRNLKALSDKQLSSYRNESIGFIFQSFNLEPTQTSFENIEMPLILAKMAKKERTEKVLKALSIIGLEDKAKNRPTELSGGQKQRVSIARAIVNEPKIIFADEPTGNLDSKNGESIIKLLRELKNKGYTIIMVTHNMDHSILSDRIIKLKDGCIER